MKPNKIDKMKREIQKAKDKFDKYEIDLTKFNGMTEEDILKITKSFNPSNTGINYSKKTITLYF